MYDRNCRADLTDRLADSRSGDSYVRELRGLLCACLPGTFGGLWECWAVRDEVAAAAAIA